MSVPTLHGWEVVKRQEDNNMVKSTVIKLFISALVATTPVPTTAYTSTGIYYATVRPLLMLPVRNGDLIQNLKTVHL